MRVFARRLPSRAGMEFDLQRGTSHGTRTSTYSDNLCRCDGDGVELLAKKADWNECSYCDENNGTIRFVLDRICRSATWLLFIHGEI